MITCLPIILFLIHLSTQRPISYKFTIQQQPQLEESFIFPLSTAFISNEQFCIGTPFQCITVQFDPGTVLPIIFGKEFSSLINSSKQSLYDRNQSSTFSLKDRDTKEFSSQKMIKGKIALDNIQFGQVHMSNFTFYYAETWSSLIKYSSIGIATYIDHKNTPNLICALHEQNETEIKRYALKIDYNKNQGELVFDEDISNTTYTKLFNIDGRLNFFGFYYKVNRVIAINKNKDNDNANSNSNGYNETMLVEHTLGIFDESFKYIQFPFYMEENIKELIVNKLECIINNYQPKQRYKMDLSYEYYLCTKQSIQAAKNIRPSFVFEYDNGNITLKEEDLFEEYNEEYMILNIIIKKGDRDEPRWIIGYPIMKHYMLERNFDMRRFTLYSKINSNTIIIVKDNMTYSLLVVFCVMMLIGLIYIIVLMTKIKTMH